MARSVDDEHRSLEILNCTAKALKSSVAHRRVTGTGVARAENYHPPIRPAVASGKDPRTGLKTRRFDETQSALVQTSDERRLRDAVAG